MSETELSPLETLMRQNAPVLPANLKNRTLAKCAAAKQKRRDVRHRQITFAFAAVFALQLLTLSRLDAQNAQLIAGNNPPRLYAPISVAELMESWQERSRQLALLMAPSKTG